MIKHYEYDLNGVCAKSVEFDVVKQECYGEPTEVNIKNISVNGGCAGFGKAFARAMDRMNIDKAYALTYGIKCGNKSTSCPNEFAKILKEIIDEVDANEDDSE